MEGVRTRPERATGAGGEAIGDDPDGNGKDGDEAAANAGAGEGLLRRGSVEVDPSAVATESGVEGNGIEGEVGDFVVVETDATALGSREVLGEVALVDEGNGIAAGETEDGGALVKTVAVFAVLATAGVAVVDEGAMVTTGGEGVTG